MGQFFDLRVPFFVPLWRRIALVVFCVGWAIFEFSSGAVLWFCLAAGIAVMATWQFFLSGWPENTENGGDE